MKKRLLFALMCMVRCHSQSPNTTHHNTPMSTTTIVMPSVDPQKDIVPEPKPETILILGDSEVGYIRPHFSEVKQSNETIYYDNKPGTTLLYWNNHISQVFNGCPANHFCNYTGHIQPTEIVVLLGTCNYNWVALQPMDNIMREIKDHNVKCVWSGSTRVYNEHHIINSLLKAKVEPTCKFIDTEALGIDLIDGVHPTSNGASKWVREIWKVKSTL